MRNYLDLTSQVALVTGASSGIGAATAILLAELGARVAVGYHGNPAGAEQVRSKIVADGGRAIAVGADVTKAGEIASLAGAVTQQLGPIDILINNAGSLMQRMRILEVKPETWDEIQNLNLKSAVLCSQAVAPSMI